MSLKKPRHDGMAYQRYGAHACAEGAGDQGGQTPREGHGISRVPDRDVHGEDQETDGASEEEQAGFPFPTRSSQDGLEAQEAVFLSRIDRREGGEGDAQEAWTVVSAAPKGAVLVFTRTHKPSCRRSSGWHKNP